MTRTYLEALAGARCPVGSEDAYLDLIESLVNQVAEVRRDRVGNLVAGKSGAHWALLVPVSEPTLLLTGQGGEKGWNFGTYGTPKDARLLLHQEVWLEGDRPGVIDGPQDADDTNRLWIDVVGGENPVPGSYATWPGSLRFQNNMVFGPGAAAKAMAATGVACLQEAVGPIEVLFYKLGSFSAHSLDRFLRESALDGCVWLKPVEAGSKLGQGALHLRAPGLPGDRDLSRQEALPKEIHFLEREDVPGVATAIRQFGLREVGLGLPGRYLGEPLEILSEEDSDSLTRAALTVLLQEEG